MLLLDLAYRLTPGYAQVCFIGFEQDLANPDSSLFKIDVNFSNLPNKLFNCEFYIDSKSESNSRFMICSKHINDFNDFLEAIDLESQEVATCMIKIFRPGVIKNFKQIERDIYYVNNVYSDYLDVRRGFNYTFFTLPRLIFDTKEGLYFKELNFN